VAKIALKIVFKLKRFSHKTCGWDGLTIPSTSLPCRKKKLTVDFFQNTPPLGPFKKNSAKH
jgi:hypothetical protein